VPHYVFHCQACKKEFEKVLHIDELGVTPVSEVPRVWERERRATGGRRV
jgi:predicted nucleic acid-binding Zn ribbon protein